MPVPKGKAAWDVLAVRALDAFMSSIGAAVWPEIESLLAEQGWVHYNLDSDIPPNRNPDPIHLSIARSRLVETGVLEESSAVLNGRPVSVWLDSRALASRGRKTQSFAWPHLSDASTGDSLAGLVTIGSAGQSRRLSLPRPLRTCVERVSGYRLERRLET